MRHRKCFTGKIREARRAVEIWNDPRILKARKEADRATKVRYETDEEDRAMTMANLNDDKAQDAVGTAADAAQDAVDKTADAATDVVEKGSDSVSETIRSTAGAVGGAVNTARQNASAGLRQANEVVAGFSENAADAVKKYPARTVLLVAVGGAVAGFMAGVLTARCR